MDGGEILAIKMLNKMKHIERILNCMPWWNALNNACFKHILLISKHASKELIQMDINEKMRNGIFTMNGEHTHSQKTNITDARQSRKSFGITDESYFQ